ncbi:1-deoxy-D-xylulose-5-phosphate synthase [Limosilactobacillus fastidiosus]|uniref:1-deoxy-D-xylulose-5-phosphate synthase n=1 Tax=Limosilactobacillus fastidiosus TaxID=2759855 RepID=A0A7W3U0B7_9LACO|nr:1-deoxy-D-xylulose-5-phosphate synthase [Limosilactobacillus fastidiosus]MBB1063543.1 1-deoxy-D-xylulose-5-phosphate synthase [Limosilactobacillus fastidiosus]MBB1086320.1 1-deoxy-D-xylulose-5-phosphate synthase [Limosilactobacillus fastidiosus]MCD7084025.1 1-deoxy-D-xylulose-5-phosphate synthase [Limosilactobacillus fastidiosus]MCD7086425.1 1-deoxy-D-xylulose-5-phosphate synthase [Limosilactobacillus fastidiosus]MCD7114219.1 1-deoxy-D-xylulose-5-phosphate synthase [Limosilactobacillus fast
MNRHPDYLLNRVNNPADIKSMSLEQLKQLATEMRQLVLERDAAIGGHVGPNLGIMETAIAYHYVFDSPHDKVVWDVSHQCYPHKMLTGRKLGFLDPDHYGDISGYTSPEESVHDFFEIGHTSTSISLAVGLAQARDLMHPESNDNIVAVIGDGSLSGGLAFEGLNNAAKLHSNLIIVVNDNQMAIDEDQGGLYKGLKELRDSNGKAENNIFKFIGLDYKYIADGNDLQTMINVFKNVKNIDHPIVLHVNTLKGKGYQPAVDDKMDWHWQPPFDIKNGKVKETTTTENYSDAILTELGKQIDDGVPVVALNAAIPGVFNLKQFQAKYPDHYYDVGIAEQDSVTTAVAMATAGARPVVFQNSTFLQRAYDQLIHDMALNDAPVVMIVRGGTIASDSATHQGTFDISMISNLPNIEYLAPTNVEELISMLRWALKQTEQPVIIREPEKKLLHGKASQDDYSLIHYDVAREGSEVAIMAVGDFWQLGIDVCEELQKKLNINATLINPKSLTGIDQDYLHHLSENHDVVVTLEDGNVSGGFGETIARYYGPKAMKVLNFGAPREFADNVPLDVLYEWYHLTPDQIVDDIEKVIHAL